MVAVYRVCGGKLFGPSMLRVMVNAARPLLLLLRWLAKPFGGVRVVVALAFGAESVRSKRSINDRGKPSSIMLVGPPCC